jgi:hypothetical protein
MARFNGRARACEVDRRADNRACEVGPAHDFSPSCSSRRAAGGRCNVVNLDRDGQLGPAPASLSEHAILTWSTATTYPFFAGTAYDRREFSWKQRPTLAVSAGIIAQ